jgi:hypothetical protein
MRLAGYHLQGSAAPGQRLTLVLWWELKSQPTAGWRVFSHLVAAPDFATVVAQNDKVPLNDYYPFSVWSLGVPAQDLYDIDVPPDAPASMQLAVGLYDPETGQRLQVVQNGQPVGDRLLLPLTLP